MATPEDQYKALPLETLKLEKISFDDFIYLRRKDIDEICDEAPRGLRGTILRLWGQDPRNQAFQQVRETFPSSSFELVSTQVEVNETDHVWIVEHVNLSGLAPCSNLFVRDETRNLWSKLNSLSGTNRMIIQGPPGVGKSTELYGWVQFQRKKKNVLYIHRNAKVGDFILVCTREEIKQYCLGRLQPDLDNTLRRLLLLINQEVKLDIVVCDGYRKEDGMLHGVISEFKNQIVIYCSSYKASNDIKGEAYHTLALRHGALVTFEMDSWKLHQYLDAWDNEVLDHNVFNSKFMIHYRYYYAGGNLSLMLMSEEQCLNELRNAFLEVDDIQAIRNGLHGQSAPTAVNILFQRIDGDFLPVSEYVSKWLLQRFPNNSTFIAEAKKIMPNNP